jgi:hypothetical protein
MKTIAHKFVEFIPNDLEDGMIYITMEYRTAVHKCICGCGNKVVTPFSPTDWKLTFDGKTVTLYPSIGNWNFDCKSHYFITNNFIKNVRRWSDNEIETNRNEDARRKKSFFSKRKRKNK